MERGGHEDRGGKIWYRPAHGAAGEYEDGHDGDRNRAYRPSLSFRTALFCKGTYHRGSERLKHCILRLTMDDVLCTESLC